MSEFEDLDSVEVAQLVIKSLRSQRSTKRSMQEELEESSMKVRDLNRLIAKQKEVRQKYVDTKDHVDSLLMTTLVEPVANISLHSPQDDDTDSDDDLNSSTNSHKMQQSSKVKGIRERIIDCRKSDPEVLAKNNSDANNDSDLDMNDGDDDEMQEIFQDFVPPSNKPTKTNLSSTSRSTDFKKTQNVDVVNSSLQKGIVIKPGQAIKVKSMGGKSRKTSQ
jgi:hypothetical protein